MMDAPWKMHRDMDLVSWNLVSACGAHGDLLSADAVASGVYRCGEARTSWSSLAGSDLAETLPRWLQSIFEVQRESY